MAELGTENLGLIHPHETVGVFVNREPLERPRRGAFEVDAGDVIARAVAGAFELLVRREPVGDAAQMGADGVERDEPIFGRLKIDDPDVVGFVLLVNAGVSEFFELADAVEFFRFLQHLGAEEILEHGAVGCGDECDEEPADRDEDVKATPADAAGVGGAPRMRSAIDWGGA